jgi:TM2 domain-containing membrane protein YozV
LALFFGWLGVHRFYLGQTGKGIAHVLFSWTFVPAVIGFIDFVAFISQSDDQFDRKYNPQLYDRKMLDREQGWNVTLPPVPGVVRANAPNQPTSAHDKLMLEVTEIRNDILRHIQSSKDFKSGIVSEIKPMVDNYIGQVRELIDRDKQVRAIVEKHSLADMDNKIFEINSKMNSTTSVAMKDEYKKALDKYIHHKQSVKEFHDQREVIALRLDSTLMSLREVKFDLLRLESLNYDEQKNGFFQIFDEKSNELSEYLSSLKQAYNENKL